MKELYRRQKKPCQRRANYNRLVQRVGAFLVKGELRREGSLSVLEALDPVTGGLVLLFRPLSGLPPRIEVPRVLPFLPPVEDAWVVELPFGVTSAARYLGGADLERLTAWARRLLLTFAELEARGLAHGRLTPGDLWVRGEAVWVSGVGVPWPDPEPDASRLVGVLRALAGEGWNGWSAARVLEALAEGRISYDEALAALGEARVSPTEPPGAPEPELPPKRREPPPSVRVKGRREADEGPGAEAPAGSEEAPADPPAQRVEPPEVVRIDEPLDPAFEVVSPEPAPRRRRVLRGVLLGLLLLLLALSGGLYWVRRPPPYVQEVRFEVVPEGSSAELYLLSSPEGSRLKEGFLAKIPGKLRFDREGVYTFEVQSPGFRPKTFALEIPVLGGRVTVRLSGR